MPLTSTIVSYDSTWPSRFEEEASRLRPIFGSSLSDIHHVGSTAVSGLAAKPEIDILVIVETQDSCDDWTKRLIALGYVRGGDLSPGHLFYRRNVDGVRTHKVHVCVQGHEQITAMLAFRDLLTSNPGLRRDYEALKLRLQRENTNGIGEYLEGKQPFIAAALQSIPGSTT